MNKVILLAMILSLNSLPANAIEYKDAHPKIYKYSAPFRLVGRNAKKLSDKVRLSAAVRATGDAIIWIGEKSKPYQPAINLASSLTNAAVTTGIWLRQ